MSFLDITIAFIPKNDSYLTIPYSLSGSLVVGASLLGLGLGLGLGLLGLGHLETGRSAPQTPSAGMDAAAVCTLVV